MHASQKAVETLLFHPFHLVFEQVIRLPGLVEVEASFRAVRGGRRHFVGRVGALRLVDVDAVVVRSSTATA